jgi:hypothetical protein
LFLKYIDTDVVEEISLEGDGKKADSNKVEAEAKAKDMSSENKMKAQSQPNHSWNCKG